MSNVSATMQINSSVSSEEAFVDKHIVENTLLIWTYVQWTASVYLN